MIRAGTVRRSVLVAGLALSFATCRDAFEPGVSARLAVAPILPSAAELASFGLTIDGVRFVAVRLPSDTLADTTLVLAPDADELALDLRVPVIRRPDTVSITIVALSGALPLFLGQQLVPVPTPQPPPEIPLDTYVGPSVDSVVVTPSNPFLLVNDSLRFQVQGYQGGVPVPQFYVAWSSSDTTVARIDSRGMLRAPAGRAAVRVRASTPSGVADSVLATFTLPAAQLVTIAGTGQVDTVGNALAVPIEVEARASDGIGVGGVSVRFRALVGGGAVTDSIVITDAAGRARTSVTLGSLLGAQSFEATVAGLTGSPVTFNATALAGAPAQVNAGAGDAQLAVVNTAVGVAPSVIVRDAGGNPVQGVSVTFSVQTGGGGVTGATQTTDAAGVATVGGWTLGTAAGTNTLRATAGALTRTFTATAIAGAPAQLVRTAGNLQSALVGTLLSVKPAVRVEDQYANPVAGASVTFGVTGGGGGITGASQLSNAAGIATVGSWTIGTSVGSNSLSVGVGAVTPVSFTATGLAGAATAILKLAGDAQTGVVHQALGVAPRVKLLDQFGNPVAGASVVYSVLAGGGLLTGATQLTDSAGIATLGSWALGTAVGPNGVVATSGALTADFTADAFAGIPAQIATLAGDAQTAVVNTLLGTPPSVVVRDSFNNPVPGISVTFTPSIGGAVTGGTATTSAAGVAQVGTWKLATLAGGNTLTAAASGHNVAFTATGQADVATQLVKLAGDGQSAIVGQSVVAMPSVKALDQFSNPVAGLTVTFGAAGGGQVTGATVATNAAGIATLGGWTLDTLAGANGVTASATGGLTAPFAATGLPDVADRLLKVTGDGQTAVVNTAVGTTPVVRVVDRYGNPVPGVTVDYDLLVDGGSLADSSVVSDALGLASPITWTIADFVATNVLEATSAGVPAVQFSVPGLPDIAAQLVRVSTDTQTALVSQAVSVPPAVKVTDQYGNPIAGFSVGFQAIVGGGNVTPLSATTDATGTARATAWTLGAVIGLNTLEATAAPLVDTVRFSATGITTTATSMALNAGDGQSGVVAVTLGTQYAVRVLDAGGAPVQGVQVHWAVDAAGGDLVPATSLTDVSGIARSTRTLGTVAGPQTATASVSGLTGSPVVFNASAQPGAPISIVKRSTDPQTGIVATLLAAPVVEVADVYGNVVPGVPVTFALAGLGALGTTLDTTDAAGRATTGSWLLGNLIGSSTVTASVTGLADAVFTATGIAGLATNVLLVDGNGQGGTVGQALAAPYRVRVADIFGNPVRNISVNWAIVSGAGSIQPGSGPTNTSGIAAATHTLGTVVGSQSAKAWVSGLSDTVTFTSNASAGAAAAIQKVAGDLQSAVVNTAVTTAPSVKVTDQFGAPVPGHPVVWAVTSGGGSLAGGGTPTVNTNAAGISQAPAWTLGTASGSNGLSATATGLTGSPVSFTATGLAGAATQMAISAGNGQSATVGTPVAVKPAVILKDQFNNPVPNAQVVFSVLSGGGDTTGGRPLTNTLGVATVGSWRLGTTAGPNALRATSAGVTAVTFGATGLAAAPTQLVFVVQPSRSIARDTIQPPVRVAFQDQFGNTNLAVSDLVSLQLGVSPAPGAKLLGVADAQAVNGVAVFPELAIDSAGSGFTLIATTSKLAGTFESDPFDVGGVIGATKDDRLNPVAAAFDPATKNVFVPGQNNALGVFDPSKGQLSVFNVLQSPPFGVAVNPTSGQAFVTTQAGPVVVFDTRAPATPLGVVDITRSTRGVAVDEANDRIYVAVDGDPSKGIPPALAVIDGKDRRVLFLIPFSGEAQAGAGVGVAYNRNDGLVYVAIPNLGVGVFDPSKQQHVTTIPIIGEKGAAGTYGVAVDLRANLVYATNRADSSMSVIDPAGLKELDRIRVGDQPEGLDVDADRGVVYVGNSGANTVSFLTLDPKAGRFTVFATLVVGPKPKAVTIDPANGVFFVPTFTDNSIRVVRP